KQICIDVVDEEGQLCLTFTDNGSGMTPNKLHKMLSFGFTEKGSGKARQQAIGVYGNGFKSGSMRLGRDALIFTKNGGCQSVGMLSQTYLESIKAQAVIVPIVPFNQQTNSLVVTEDSEASLAAILKHSLIPSLERLHAHFDSIPSKKGTKIVIWNIRRAKDGNPELDFDPDVSDICMPQIHIEELRKSLKSSASHRAEQNVPDMEYSLRAYLSILYLKPRTQIILRGKKVLAKLVAKRLTHIEHDVYKPHFSKERVKVTFGLNPKNKDHYGIMMYHKNRLIKSYEKVGCQIKSSGQRAGVGVIGVIECNFLKPAHNKQDFEYTKEYRLTLGALGLKLNDYWREVTEKRAREKEFQALERLGEKVDRGPVWLQCEECLKWRSVPPGHYSVTPEKWNCSQNPNPHFRSCSSPEEAEESDELLTPSYQKPHKKQEPSKGRKREKSLEVCGFEGREAKHQVLSRSSSEPCRPAVPPSPTADHTPLAEDSARTQDRTAEVTRDRGGERSIKTQTQIRKRTRGPTHVADDTRPEGPGLDEEMETNMVAVEGGADQAEQLSHNRTTTRLVCVLKKKSRLWEAPDSEGTQDGLNPGKEAGSPQTLSKTRRDSSGRADKPGDIAQYSCSLAWSLPSAQTAAAAEGPPSRPPPPQGGEREATVRRLARVEEEAQTLRKLLGVEVTKVTRGTMTTADASVENPTATASTATTETGCQTEVGEVKRESPHQSSASGPGAPGPREKASVQGQRAVGGQKEQSEQARARREKNETQGSVTDGDSDPSALTDTGTAVNLRCFRSNVVALLSALLPQVDLAGISTDTTDVENILQQIIDVNSLKH
ncbi:MORC family CW-type zinc finger protein 3, partial [Diretmus argenteus]